MDNILLFTPRHIRAAEKNLADYIDFARNQLTIFGASLDFDAMLWDVTESCGRPGQGNKKETITFCTQATTLNAIPAPMCESFGPFARAYIRYEQALRPVAQVGQRMAALRALEAALKEHGKAISATHLNADILNRAAHHIRTHFNSPDTAYRVSLALAHVAEHMVKNGLTVVPITWKNPIKRPKGPGRVGREFDENRAKKMPSRVAIEAIPHIYRQAREPIDVLAISAISILMASPDRISEELSLPVQCVVESEDKFGLRWWPAKGAAPMVKWVIPSMSGIVRESVKRIKDVTAPARTIGRWYEKHRDQLYLSENLKYLRSEEWLTADQAREILWGDGAAPRI